MTGLLLTLSLLTIGADCEQSIKYISFGRYHEANPLWRALDNGSPQPNAGIFIGAGVAGSMAILASTAWMAENHPDYAWVPSVLVIVGDGLVVAHNLKIGMKF